MVFGSMDCEIIHQQKAYNSGPQCLDRVSDFVYSKNDHVRFTCKILERYKLLGCPCFEMETLDVIQDELGIVSHNSEDANLLESLESQLWIRYFQNRSKHDLDDILL